MWVSELLPHTAKCVDDIALVKTVHTNAINHDPACTYVMTGSEVPGKPSIGSWLAYGLGSESNDLPAFVVLTPNWKSGAAAQALFTRMWSSGFLASKYTGVVLAPCGRSGALRAESARSHSGQPPRHARYAARTEPPDRRSLRRSGNADAYRAVRDGVPHADERAGADRPSSSESQETLDLYGPDVSKPGTYAASALLARRLVERGVRVVQILHRGWDQHGNLPRDLTAQCQDTDQPTAALLMDLKRRGLLEKTVVAWGGEFGRTVYSQGTLTAEDYGRDHHPRNFCMWLAGGGVKGGQVYGETDDFSYNVVDRPVHVNDFNATMLHCLGIDHERFTVKFQGLDQRLTGVESPKVIPELLTI